MGETFFGFGPPRKRLSKAVSRKQTEAAPQKSEGIQKKNRALKQKLTGQIDENKTWEREITLRVLSSSTAGFYCGICGILWL